MTDATAAEAVIAEAHRREWARVLAATVRVARDLDLAEECVQEAYASALEIWVSAGIPGNPAAWLTTTAKRRAIDAIRRDKTLRSRLPLLVEPEEAVDEVAMRELTDEDARDPSEALPDERLRLIFTCCHPALAQEAQVALTLRLVCGVPATDIARAFLVSEPTLAARITRAKKKISTARIPYRVPQPAELPDRLRAVLAVIHLLFTTGHTAPSGPSLVRADPVDQAMHLARMLCELMPDEAEVRGLRALLLVTDARRATRADADGRLVRLKDQDRSQWDRAALAEAHDMIVGCLRAGPPGNSLSRYVMSVSRSSDRGPAAIKVAIPLRAAGRRPAPLRGFGAAQRDDGEGMRPKTTRRDGGGRDLVRSSRRIWLTGHPRPHLAGTGRRFSADHNGEVQVRLTARHLLQAFGDVRAGLVACAAAQDTSPRRSVSPARRKLSSGPASTGLATIRSGSSSSGCPRTGRGASHATRRGRGGPGCSCR